MQTFITARSFTQIARELDWRRLGKQRVEAMQIINTLEGVKKGWANHPAVKMWKGWENELASYGLAMCREWVRRGYKDSITPFFLQRYDWPREQFPLWITDELILSHQSNLVRKNPAHYQSIYCGVPPDLPYVWPR